MLRRGRESIRVYIAISGWAFQVQDQGAEWVNARDNVTVKLIYCSYDKGEDIRFIQA